MKRILNTLTLAIVITILMPSCFLGLFRSQAQAGEVFVVYEHQRRNADDMPMRLLKPRAPTGTALIPVDGVVDNLPFIVRRDHRIVAAFARKTAAEEWAQMRSFNDESKFTVHTAQEVIATYQDGEAQ
jgi:hypothetical protein